MKLTQSTTCLIIFAVLFLNACSAPRNSKGTLVLQVPRSIALLSQNPESVHFLNSRSLLRGPGKASRWVHLSKFLLEPLLLPPGRYHLELACNTESFEIKKNKTTSLNLKTLLMRLPVQDARARLALSVKCEIDQSKNMVGKTSRGKFGNKIVALFSPKKMHGYVGLKKVTFDGVLTELSLKPVSLVPPEKFSGKTFGYYFPKILTGLQVTESFEIGKTLLLPKGSYNFELHGTRRTLDVQDKSPLLQLKLFSLKGGTPTAGNTDATYDKFYFLNNTAELKFGEEYLVFSGTHNISFAGNEKSYPHYVGMPKSRHEFVVNAITALQKCPPWELECKHHKKFALFKRNTRYPFARGSSESFLYFFNEPNLEVANLGTFALRKKVETNKEITEEKLANIAVKLNIKQNDYLETEFARIEPVEKSMNGSSFDLSFDKKNKMTLFTGTYEIAQYTLNRRTKKRQRVAKKFTAKQNISKTVEVTVYKKSLQPFAKSLNQQDYNNERIKIY